MSAAADSPYHTGAMSTNGGGEAVKTARRLRATAVNPDVQPDIAKKQQHQAAVKKGLDDDRECRVFDPKVRSIGIDRQLLDEQMKERQHLRELEMRRDAEYDKMMVQMDKQQQYLQRECDKIRMDREKDLTAYRRTFQKKEGSKEWHLNDPNAKKKDLPARIGDNDPRCGPSSLQKFDGEDLNGQSRKKAQAQQMKQWAQQQQDEKAMKKWLQDERDRMWEERAEEVNKRVWDMEQLQLAQKRQAVLTTADFNKKMAEQKRKEAAAQRHQDALNSLEEIQNQLDSDFLGETATAPSAGRGKHFKGLPPEHLQAIRNEQAQQQEELRQRRIREQEENLLECRKEAMQLQMARRLEEKILEEKRDLMVKLNNDRQAQRVANLQKEAQRQKLYAAEIGEQVFRKHLPSTNDPLAKGKLTR